jgi:hypothetical protein
LPLYCSDFLTMYPITTTPPSGTSTMARAIETFGYCATIPTRQYLNMGRKKMPVLEAYQLRKLGEGFLIAAGAPENEARLVSDPLVKANLAGHDSHGIARTLRYVDGVLKGRTRPRPRLPWCVRRLALPFWTETGASAKWLHPRLWDSP